MSVLKAFKVILPLIIVTLQSLSSDWNFFDQWFSFNDMVDTLNIHTVRMGTLTFCGSCLCTAH